jgi:hypothetical protein
MGKEGRFLRHVNGRFMRMNVKGFPESGCVVETLFFTRDGDDTSHFGMGDTLGLHQILDGSRAKQLPEGAGGAVFVE